MQADRWRRMSCSIVVFGDQGLILSTAEETVYLPASPLQAPGIGPEHYCWYSGGTGLGLHDADGGAKGDGQER